MYLLQTYYKSKTLLYKALSQKSGIAEHTAIQACDQLGLSKHITLEDLSSFQLQKIEQIVKENLYIEKELRALVQEKISNLISISCYRGFRHRQALPCRGQRTHTNARTSRKFSQKRSCRQRKDVKVKKQRSAHNKALK